jgi:hypothetical protein
MKMIPHDMVQGTRSTAEPRQPTPGPRHRVEDSSGTQPVKLLLIAVGKGVPQLDQILIVSLVPAPGLARTPANVMRRNAATYTADPYSPEVLLQAPQVRVPAIDHAPHGCGSDQHGLRARASARHADHRLGR